MDRAAFAATSPACYAKHLDEAVSDTLGFAAQGLTVSVDLQAAFDESALIAEAREKSGFDDFGSSEFQTPLRLLLASLVDAPLNAVGAAVLRTSIRRSLVQRLRAEDWFSRHPEILDERVAAPTVIVGMMRSGTTLMQRLLARDPRFHCALGWEIAEPVPRFDAPAGEPDPRIASGVQRSKQMREFAPALHAIHPTDALEADEEIVFLADAFLSHVPEASCDVPIYRAWLDRQDFTPAYRHLYRMLQLLQWQKRRRGEVARRWVLKTPAHLGYLDTLFATFPDAHVVQMHRNPLDTIASGASLNTTLWRLYSDAVDPAVVARQWLERMAWATRRGLAARAAMSDAERRFTDVGYRAALTDPLAEVARIGSATDLAPDRAASDAMERWLDAEARKSARPHRYSIADFGLAEATVRDAFGDYLERFGAYCD